MLLALASILTLTAAAPTLQRIIGGELVNSNNTGGTPYEFMTFLEISVGPNRVGYCGASLISSNMIVTAAHCTYSSIYLSNLFIKVLRI